MIDSELMKIVSKRSTVPEVAQFESVQANLDSSPSGPIPQPTKPLSERGSTVLAQILEQLLRLGFAHESNVAYKLQDYNEAG